MNELLTKPDLDIEAAADFDWATGEFAPDLPFESPELSGFFPSLDTGDEPTS
ncbi:MAG: hypothetical protein IPH03_16645 [Tetrasphaera sp.]|jgi:hypothetical protein|nr:hypothetical protein [Tetrasphaera sp.]